MNLCATYDGFSCGLGGYCPQGKTLQDCVSGRIMSILDEAWNQDSSFMFNDSTALHGNSRPACPLPPPPIGKYSHCPKMTHEEGIVQSSLYNTALNAFVSEGVNCSVLSFAGPTSDVDKYFLNNINVNTDSPRSGKFVMSTRTTHITCFDRFLSNSVVKQCKHVVNVVNDVSDTLQKLRGESSGVDTFANKVLEHQKLPFATADQEQINKLTIRHAHMTKSALQ